MKKRLLAGLATVAFLLGTAGMASATLYTEQLDFNLTLGKDLSEDSGTFDWYHSTPADFEVPWDEVISAYLTLQIQRLADDPQNNEASVTAGTLPLGSVEGSPWTIIGSGESRKYQINISDIFDPWSDGGVLEISFEWKTDDTYEWVPPHGNKDGYWKQIDNYIRLQHSTLTLVYTNGVAPTLQLSPPQNPVPEPATMLLLISGLAGLAGLSMRIRKN